MTSHVLTLTLCLARPSTLVAKLKVQLAYVYTPCKRVPNNSLTKLKTCYKNNQETSKSQQMVNMPTLSSVQTFPKWYVEKSIHLHYYRMIWNEAQTVFYKLVIYNVKFMCSFLYVTVCH